MNYHKGILCLSIVLGVFVGGYLGTYSTEVVLPGAVVGGLLGGLVYYLISWAVSLRINRDLPYDSLDEHHQVNNNWTTRRPETRAMQDAHMDDFMSFPPRTH